MALLWEHSRTWRAIVRATRNPYVLGGFFVASVSGATAIAWGSQAATDSVAKDTLKELEEFKTRDFETARYAQHSKAALGKMFDGVRGIERNEKEENNGRPVMRLPPIQWHPGAIEREKKTKLRQRELNADNVACGASKYPSHSESNEGTAGDASSK